MSKTKKKKLIIALVSVLAVAVLAVSAILIMNNSQTSTSDSKGVVGRVSADWDTGISQSENSSQGIQIPGYSTAEMKGGDTQLRLSIGNPKANNCGFYASLELEDGTVLYESELLEPGYGLKEIPLTQTLKKGNYDAVVCYNCVTLDESHKPLNSARSKFTLIVN